MATILVDYENVSGSKGMKGVEYLTQNDHLIIFYSSTCHNIAGEYMDSIKDSGCRFSIYKLKRPGKNALDFYIASAAGKLGSQGNDQIAIVSRDKGFEAIRDFFAIDEDLKNAKIVVSDDIEHGLEKLTDPDDLDRRQQIRQKLRIVDLEVEYARIQESERIRRKIMDILENTEYSSMADNIVGFFTSKKADSSKKLYTGTLHEFGLKNGVAIYRLLKEVV